MRFEPHLMLPVLAGIHFVAMPMYPRLPLAVLFAIAFLSLWSWLLFHNRVRRPGKIMLLLLVLMVVGLLFLGCLFFSPLAQSIPAYATASALLFGLVMAFNMFADALQDALDPKKVSS